MFYRTVILQAQKRQDRYQKQLEDIESKLSDGVDFYQEVQEEEYGMAISRELSVALEWYVLNILV